MDRHRMCRARRLPRELAKVAMPEYIIEPPDILSIEAISLIPPQPYLLRPLDSVSISSTGLRNTASQAAARPSDPVTGLSEDLVLNGEYRVQPNGTIQLGYKLGAIQAAGLTVEMLQEQILEMLKKEYREPNVWITLAQMAGQQEISGEHLVAPDGRINLGTYGRVRVVGSTIEEARTAIEAHSRAIHSGPPNRPRRRRLQQQSILRRHPRRRLG